MSEPTGRFVNLNVPVRPLASTAVLQVMLLGDGMHVLALGLVEDWWEPADTTNLQHENTLHVSPTIRDN